MARTLRTDRTAWALAAAALAAAMPAGCANVDPSEGYTTASQYPRDVRTVAVPIFHRAAGEYRRDFEIRLTEAVKKRIAQETGYRLADKSHADTILLGTLRWIHQRPLSYNTRMGRPREYQVRLSVDLVWKDLRGEGRIRMERKDFRVAATYLLARPFREDFFMGSEDAANRLAQRIVEQLADSW